jgi:hypothetical protein
MTPQVIQFNCPTCQAPLTVPIQLAGVTGPCPKCGNSITSPAAPTPPPVTPAFPTAVPVPQAPPDIQTPAPSAPPVLPPFPQAPSWTQTPPTPTGPPLDSPLPPRRPVTPEAASPSLLTGLPTPLPLHPLPHFPPSAANPLHQPRPALFSQVFSTPRKKRFLSPRNPLNPNQPNLRLSPTPQQSHASGKLTPTPSSPNAHASPSPPSRVARAKAQTSSAWASPLFSSSARSQHSSSHSKTP